MLIGCVFYAFSNLGQEYIVKDFSADTTRDPHAPTTDRDVVDEQPEENDDKSAEHRRILVYPADGNYQGDSDQEYGSGHGESPLAARSTNNSAKRNAEL